MTASSVPHEFSLHLWVTNAEGFDAFLVNRLEWNPDVLQLVSVEPGALSDPVLFFGGLDADGSLEFTSGPFAPGPSGSGQLAALNFIARGHQESALDFVDPLGFDEFVFFLPQGSQVFVPFGQVTGATVDVLQKIPEPGTGVLLLTSLAASVVRRARSFPRPPAA